MAGAAVFGHQLRRPKLVRCPENRPSLALGCGTGLMGEKLRPVAERLEGYDISAAMLK
ncbi:hypothetical protein X755_28430 [Mesorhizobium sp. LNJC405B00]|nr:hypothetical protein X755_28430 [Mesorhizobium sp. LNJC405B00]